VIDYSLYVVTTDLSHSAQTHIDIAGDAVAGGATVIQLREKRASTKDILLLAQRIRELTRKAGVCFIVNDRIDIGLATDADGVHIGQNDMPLREARRLLGGQRIIGVTATNMEEAIEAERNGADYLGVSPIFATPSKEDAGQPMGLEKLKEIRENVRIPIVAIGGITGENVARVISTGADGIAVISAIAAASDRRKATAELLRRIDECRQSSMNR
jgi:thiamine-phosphate pyrophosphorylase